MREESGFDTCYAQENVRFTALFSLLFKGTGGLQRPQREPDVSLPSNTKTNIERSNTCTRSYALILCNGLLYPE